MKFNLTAHKELWNWLADNPLKNGQDWPGWLVNGGAIKPAKNCCFACEYGVNTANKYSYCKKCPLVFPVNEAFACCDESAPTAQREISLNSEATLDVLADLARQIANLPVREGVECE